MSYLEKITTSDELRARVAELRKSGKTIVHSHGSFDVLHPGHVRHLSWAKQQGDVLVVTLNADRVLRATPFVRERLRAEHLAAIEVVDYVAVVSEPAVDVLQALRPDVYVKGREFRDVYDGDFGRQRKLVEDYGGKVRFSSGDAVYSLSEYLEQQRERQTPESEQARAYCQRHGIDEAGLRARLSDAQGKKVLVVGEAIVDEYVYCDSLGMSADSPTLVVRPQNSERFLGGAGIVAQHVAALGAHSCFVSVVGDDSEAQFVRDVLAERGLDDNLLTDGSRPTICKRRFLADNKKLLNVNRFSEQEIDKELERRVCERIEALGRDADAVIISDFGYGMLTPKLVALLCGYRRERGTHVVGDVQVSSQMGRVTRLREITVITPSEREARTSLWDKESGVADLGVLLLDKTRNEAVVMTLGARGLIVIDTCGRPWPEIAESPHLHRIKQQLTIDYLPAFGRYVVDPMGAGDALLATLATALAAGASIAEAAYLANCAAAVAVRHMGNIAVSSTDVLDVIADRGDTKAR